MPIDELKSIPSHSFSSSFFLLFPCTQNVKLHMPTSLRLLNVGIIKKGKNNKKVNSRVQNIADLSSTVKWSYELESSTTPGRISPLFDCNKILGQPLIPSQHGCQILA